MSAEMEGGTPTTTPEEERRGSGGCRNMAVAAMTLPVTVGVAAGSDSKYEEIKSPAGKGDAAESRRLPHLRDYDLKVSWRVYMGAFLFSAARQAVCNYLSQSGILDGPLFLLVPAKAVATFGIMLSASYTAQTLLGPRCRSPLIVIFAVWSTLCYGVVFGLSPGMASLTVVPNVLLQLIVGMCWSKRACAALVLLGAFMLMQFIVTFVITNLPLVQSKMPEPAQQFLVPVLKTIYLGFVTEFMTLAWKKMYRRPISPFIMTEFLMIALVSAETMGVVGLLATVDSEKIWTNAAIFCTTTIVMETNSRSGILSSFLYKLMGKKYEFSDAAHVFRWGKMWASYCWVCAFSGFVVTALITGVRPEESNFTFLRWEPWALLFIYVVQQMVTDVIYVAVQNYIRPSPLFSQAVARCLVLGQATPLFGQNQHYGDDGETTSPKSSMEEEYEAASFKFGPWTITVEAVLMFVWFEYSMSIWNNFVRGQFCIYGTFLPSEAGSCD